MTAPFSTEKVSLTSCQGNVSLQGSTMKCVTLKFIFGLLFFFLFCFNVYKLYTKEGHS